MLVRFFLALALCFGILATAAPAQKMYRQLDLPSSDERSELQPSGERGTSTGVPKFVRAGMGMSGGSTAW